LIVNTVVKATLTSKRKGEDFGKGRNGEGVNEKAYIGYFPGVVLLVHVKRIKITTI